MAGSFTIANPHDAEHWHRVGVGYGWLTFSAVIGFMAAVVAFVRNQRRDRVDREASRLTNVATDEVL
jgi:hypothetical protein